MDMKTTLKLAELYRTREQLQKHRERGMDRNIWLGFVNRGITLPRGPDERVQNTSETERMADAIGGTGALATVIQIGFVEAICKMQDGIDKEITDLGGEI